MYKVNSKNLKGSFSISNLILFIGLISLVVIGLAIFPAKIKEVLYTEKVEAHNSDFYYYSTNEIYRIKFYYIDKNIQTTGKGNPIVIYYQ